MFQNMKQHYNHYRMGVAIPHPSLRVLATTTKNHI